MASSLDYLVRAKPRVDVSEDAMKRTTLVLVTALTLLAERTVRIHLVLSTAPIPRGSACDVPASTSSRPWPGLGTTSSNGENRSRFSITSLKVGVGPRPNPGCQHDVNPCWRHALTDVDG